MPTYNVSSDVSEHNTCINVSVCSGSGYQRKKEREEIETERQRKREKRRKGASIVFVVVNFFLSYYLFNFNDMKTHKN